MKPVWKALIGIIGCLLLMAIFGIPFLGDAVLTLIYALFVLFIIALLILAGIGIAFLIKLLNDKADD